MTADFNAELDQIHLDSLAALAIVRDGFAAARRRVDVDAATFQAQVDQLAAALPDPWPIPLATWDRA
jgi:hypothetical protein